jgi:hypothetical protein
MSFGMATYDQSGYLLTTFDGDTRAIIAPFINVPLGGTTPIVHEVDTTKYTGFFKAENYLGYFGTFSVGSGAITFYPKVHPGGYTMPMSGNANIFASGNSPSSHGMQALGIGGGMLIDEESVPFFYVGKVTFTSTSIHDFTHSATINTPSKPFVLYEVVKAPTNVSGGEQALCRLLNVTWSGGVATITMLFNAPDGVSISAYVFCNNVPATPASGIVVYGSSGMPIYNSTSEILRSSLVDITPKNIISPTWSYIGPYGSSRFTWSVGISTYFTTSINETVLTSACELNSVYGDFYWDEEDPGPFADFYWGFFHDSNTGAVRATYTRAEGNATVLTYDITTTSFKVGSVSDADNYSFGAGPGTQGWSVDGMFALKSDMSLP